MGGGLTAGNTRAARIARWLKANGQRGTKLVASLEDGDQVHVVATYGAKQCVPELGAELDGLLVDFATEAGGVRRGHLRMLDEAGEVVCTHPVQARPEKGVQLDEGTQEFEGTANSVAVQLQRHMEVRARLDASDRVALQNGFVSVVELVSGVVERLSDRLERSEQRGEETRRELEELQVSVLEEREEDAAAAAPVDNTADKVLDTVTKLLVARTMRAAPPAPAAEVEEETPPSEGEILTPEGE